MTRLLWQHRELVWQFTLRNIELRHKGSHLGLIWSFLYPLLMLALYVLVFGYIFDSRFGVIPNETQIDHSLGIFFGLTLFHFAGEVISTSGAIIMGNPNFVKKVVFPLEILPVASVLSAAFHMLVSLMMLIAGIVFLGNGLTALALWLPVIIFPLILFVIGISWLLSALGVFFRDINQIMPFVGSALMFASAVFYSAQKIPPAVWTWLRFNPLLLAIDLARDVGLWGRPINFHHLAYLYACGLVVCYGGYLAFRKMKSAFADVL